MKVTKDYSFILVEKIREKCLLPQEKGRILLLHGRPGCGKSVFMSQLYNELNKTIKCLTEIKAELLKLEDSPQKVYKLFHKVSEEDTPKILILDSLDVLAHTKREELQEWLFYIDKLKNIRNMTVICACRTFEVEHLYPLSCQEWSEKYNLEDELNTPEFEDYIKKVLKNLNYDYKKLSSEFKNFIRIPLHLKIVTKIIEKKGDPQNIATLQGIYTEFLNIFGVLKDENVFSLLIGLAEKMIENRATWISYSTIAPHISEVAETELIEINEIENKITFCHQTLIDYFVAWKVINQEQSLVDFLLEHRQNPFIRPTLYHILGLLRDKPERLFKELEDIFLSATIPEKKIGFTSQRTEIRNYIKITILSAIGSWSNPTGKEAKFLSRILRESPPKDNLIEQFFDRNPNSNWFSPLKENLILPLLQDEKKKWIWTIIKYLTNIATDIPDEVLDIALNFLKEKPNSDISWFLEMISDKLHKIEFEDSVREKFATLLEEKVRKDFIEWYFETVLSCKRLAKINPQRGLKLYLEAVEKELLRDKSKISVDNSIVSSHSQKEVFPSIYEGAPKNTLKELTVFFEKFFSKNYERGQKILDEPLINIYGVENHYGLDAMYNWYKEKMLSFSIKSPEEVKELIELLSQSQWRTQQELSLLGKLQCPKNYSNDIYIKIKEIISALKSNNLKGYYPETFINLLQKGLSALSDSQRKEIISDLIAIDLEDKSNAQDWLWGPFHHIPKQFQTKEIKDKLQKLKEKFNFGRYKYSPPFEMTGGVVVSPVPKEKLKNMEPNELLQFLIKNRDLKESWQVKNDKILGGVKELAREVSEVLTGDLRKYKKVIRSLTEDSQNDVYTSWFFASLSNKEPDKESIKWLIPIVLSIWKRESLQLDVIRYIRKIENIITKEQFIELKPVLIELTSAKDPEKDRFFEYRKQGYSNDALTEGINSVRGELCEVLLRLNKRFLDEDIYNALKKLAEDKSISVRASLVFYLPLSLQSWGWEKCFALFTKAFEKGPEEYSKGIIKFLGLVPKDNFKDVKPILLKLKNSGEPKLIEAYITLMVIYYFRKFVNKDEVLKIMEDASFPMETKKEGFNILVGRVKHEKAVDLSIAIIKHLITYKKHFEDSFHFLFLNAQPEDIEKFVPIIKKIAETEPFDGHLISYIFDYLGKCILINPVLVFETLSEILNILKSFESQKDYKLEVHKSARSEAPINIVNTILECYPKREEEALATLDRLSEFHFEGVETYLKSFDRL